MPRKVGDSLVRTVLDGIFTGKLGAGDRLPSIGEMSREYRMSVVSVREAVQKLSLMGLVRTRQGEGTFLCANIPSIVDILDARKHVELATCLLAAKNGTDDQFRALDGLIAGMEEDFAKGDDVAYTQKDLAFHLAIGRMSGNAILSAYLENIQDLLYYLQQRTHMLQGTIESAYRFHRRIAAALKKRDGAGAQALIAAHIESVKRAWREYDTGTAGLSRSAGPGGVSGKTRTRPTRRRTEMARGGRGKALTVGAALLAALVFGSADAAETKTIRIGAVYPLTGNIASTGLDCKRGVELAVDIINGKYDLDLPLARTEGLPNLGGAKMEIVFADTKGEPKNGQAEAERLVTQERVVGMIGAYQSSVTKTASQATERLKIPYVCSDSSSPTLTERGLKYFFRVSPHDAIFARDQFNFFKDLEKAKKVKIRTVAALYENTEFGSNVGKQIEKLAPEFGYKVVADISYAANATDVTSEVGRLIKAGPDVLMHASYITDAILFTKTFKEMGFAPRGITTFAGYIEPGYLPTVRGDGNFMVVRSTFALDLAKRKPLVAKVNELFRKKYGIDMSENAARSFTAPFVLAEAINRAKTTEAEAVVKALLATDIPGSQVIYPWKGIKFDPQSHQNVHARGILVQIQNEKYVTVWPFDSAAADVIWPFPAWKSRK